MSKCKIAVVCFVVGLFVSVSGGVAEAIIMDGTGSFAEGYQIGFDIGYRIDEGGGGGHIVTGGKLFFGTDEDSGKQYMAFTMPLNFVDNTYGYGEKSTVVDNSQLDWAVKADKPNHTFKDLLNSDSFGSGKTGYLPLTLNKTNGQTELVVDYIAEIKDVATGIIVDYRSGGFNERDSIVDGEKYVQSQGGVISGSTDGILDIVTTLETNIKNFATAAEIANGADSKNITESTSGVIALSPELQTTAAGDPPNYAPVDASFNDWIFEIGYEFEFAAGTFGEGWNDLSLAFTEGEFGDDIGRLNFITVGASHVSPHKDISGLLNGIEITPIHNPVPEPGTFLLFGIGLAGMGILRKNRA